MKRISRNLLGVTLLEVMLVLAIAAMIIVMSIRYYQSASNSQQVNMAMSEIQAITAAADNLAIGSGSYAAASTTSIKNVIGSKNMISPTGGTITITGQTATVYVISMPLNTAICASVLPKLSAISKITSATCSSGTLGYTYNNAL
jgi:Tfp pilus assembly protein PilE